jgi:hypothetical protein
MMKSFLQIAALIVIAVAIPTAVTAQAVNKKPR